MNLLIFRPARAGLSAGKPIAEKANREGADGLDAAEEGEVQPPLQPQPVPFALPHPCVAAAGWTVKSITTASPARST